MEANILKEDKDILEVQLSEADHGFLNMLKEALWKQSGVEMASFRLEHPEVSKPVFVLRTKGKEAKKVWNSALDSVSADLEKLGKEFKKLK
ncbi:MAG TPA: RpoL/Rpb11 RNA polymerase subunit family protein [Candidatus Nanoarchaeia archaeon]|nr:RpoL/Rpb11 RNA polymerase subunit family protein [Candidatus Nanoarchaeia archaeon]